MAILITGVAGFIGAALAARLLERGDTVCGIDNLNDYYDVSLKRARLARVRQYPKFSFLDLDVTDRAAVAEYFTGSRFDAIVHLAAQVGVRGSDPFAYMDTNLVGFGNVLEGARQCKTPHFVFASSSSVYGANRKLPFSEHDRVDHPLSLYAATKKANELMAHVYAHLHGLPCTGLRFFTVYGPWGRPDMALFTFTKSIVEGRPIQVFNNGNMIRDFTYIDDIVEGVVRVLDCPLVERRVWHRPSDAPYRIYNIGSSRPVNVLQYVEVLEQYLGKKATIKYMPAHPGDMSATAADVSELRKAVAYRPRTPIETGVGRFVEWYRDYYRVKAPASSTQGVINS